MARFIQIVMVLGLFSTSSWAQNLLLEGTVIDSMRHPIPFSTIEIRHKTQGKGVAANSKGAFSLSFPNGLWEDSILVSALGFQPKKLSIKDVYTQKPLRISLSKQLFKLQTIIVKPISSGIFEEGHLKLTPGGIRGGLLTENMTQIGVHIKNSKNRSGYLKTISYFLTLSGKFRAPFRIRIYAVTKDSIPIGKDRLNESLILYPTVKDGWNTMDVSKQQIIFPPEGLVVAMEYIITKKKYWYKTRIRTSVYKNYGGSLGCTWEYEEPQTFVNHLGSGWKRWVDPGKVFGLENPRNALIKVSIAY